MAGETSSQPSSTTRRCPQLPIDTLADRLPVEKSRPVATALGLAPLSTDGGVLALTETEVETISGLAGCGNSSPRSSLWQPSA